jgi:hypothetical protein
VELARKDSRIAELQGQGTQLEQRVKELETTLQILAEADEKIEGE